MNVFWNQEEKGYHLEHKEVRKNSFLILTILTPWSKTAYFRHSSVIAKKTTPLFTDNIATIHMTVRRVRTLSNSIYA